MSLQCASSLSSFSPAPASSSGSASSAFFFGGVVTARPAIRGSSHFRTSLLSTSRRRSSKSVGLDARLGKSGMQYWAPSSRAAVTAANTPGFTIVFLPVLSSRRGTGLNRSLSAAKMILASGYFSRMILPTVSIPESKNATMTAHPLALWMVQPVAHPSQM